MLQNYGDMVSVLGDDAPSYQVVKNWSLEFQCGRKTCEYAKANSRPQSVCIQENISRVCDRLSTIRRLAERHAFQTVQLEQ